MYRPVDIDDFSRNNNITCVSIQMFFLWTILPVYLLMIFSFQILSIIKHYNFSLDLYFLSMKSCQKLNLSYCIISLVFHDLWNSWLPIMAYGLTAQPIMQLVIFFCLFLHQIGQLPNMSQEYFTTIWLELSVLFKKIYSLKPQFFQKTIMFSLAVCWVSDSQSEHLLSQISEWMKR